MLDTKAIATYKFGDSREVLTAAADIVRTALTDEAKRAAVAEELASLLNGDSTYCAKDFACRQLWLAGGAAEVPAIAALLNDAQTADIARYALEKMQAPEAGAALRAALDTAPAEAKAGIADSLGMRRDEEAVKALAAVGDDANALAALGRIGTPQAVRALEEGEGEARDHALIFAAEQVLKDGKANAAAKIYKDLKYEPHAAIIRGAALRGLARLEEDAGKREALENEAKQIAPKRKAE